MTLELDHIAGLKMLNRIAFVLLNKDRMGNVGCGSTRKKSRNIKSIRLIEDSQALWKLANEIGNEAGST